MGSSQYLGRADNPGRGQCTLTSVEILPTDGPSVERMPGRKVLHRSQ